MGYYVGLDVSMKTTFICIVDEKGKVVKEVELLSTPEIIGSFLIKTGLQIEKVGLESDCLTHYLKKGLKKMGYEVIGVGSRKMSPILATIINKTDKNDARGIAEALRVGHYRECVHRSDEAVEIRTVLHVRRTAVEGRTHLVTSIKGHLKVYGLRLGQGSGKSFRKKVYTSLEETQKDADKWILEYNTERTHSGKYCFGKTPMQTFLDAKHLAQEKMLDKLTLTTFQAVK